MTISSADLKAVATGGLINEDVMQRIFDISDFPLPFTDLIGSDTTSNSYTEWTTDELQPVNMSNAKVDGQDTNTDDDTALGARVGNQHQISTKTVATTSRADASGTIGFAVALARQVMQRQKELRRDVEAISLGNQGSQADDGNTIPGLAGALGAWLETNTYRGATGSDGGFSGGVVSAPTLGTARGLTETLVRDMAQSIYTQGGNPTHLMMTVTAKRLLSEYMFTSSARIATLTSETTQSLTDSAAKGSVNVFLTDFGVVLRMIPNRLQQPSAAGAGTGGADVSDVFGIDPAMLRHGYLRGYRVEPLAKTGLAETRQMSVDWTLKVLNEKAHGVIADVDEGVAVVT